MEFRLSDAIQLTSRLLAGLRPARKLVADLVSDLSQTGSSYLDMSRQLIRAICDQLCDLVVSWVVPDKPNSITLSSVLAREPTRELDSVMEFGLNTSQPSLKSKCSMHLQYLSSPTNSLPLASLCLH